MKKDRFNVRRNTPYALNALVIFTLAFIAFTLVWAHRTIVPEVLQAAGQIEPQGQLRHVGHFDGGVVHEVLARPGDVVSEGAVLAVINKPEIAAEITRLQSQLTINQAELDRLQQLLDAVNSDVTQTSNRSELYVPVLANAAPEQTSEQIRSYRAQRASLKAKADRAAQSLDAARRIAAKVQNRITTAQNTRKRAEDSFNRGLSTVVAFEQVQQMEQRLASEGLEADIRVLEAHDRHSDALADVDEAKLVMQEQALGEMRSARNERVGLETELSVHTERLARAQVTSPISGTIQTIAVSTPGEVVSAGAQIASILPKEDQLIARLKLSPTDIGHLEMDTPVKVTLTTFDQRRYGHLDGEIITISPTSDVDETGEAHYMISVALSEQFVGSARHPKKVRAGMEVAAEFISSSKSLLDYFVGPIRRAVTTAFTER